MEFGTKKIKKEKSKNVCAMKSISISWPGGSFSCEKGDEIEVKNLSAEVLEKLKQQEVIKGVEA